MLPHAYSGIRNGPTTNTSATNNIEAAQAAQTKSRCIVRVFPRTVPYTSPFLYNTLHLLGGHVCVVWEPNGGMQVKHLHNLLICARVFLC